MKWKMIKTQWQLGLITEFGVNVNPYQEKEFGKTETTESDGD